MSHKHVRREQHYEYDHHPQREQHAAKFAPMLCAKSRAGSIEKSPLYCVFSLPMSLPPRWGKVRMGVKKILILNIPEKTTLIVPASCPAENVFLSRHSCEGRNPHGFWDTTPTIENTGENYHNAAKSVNPFELMFRNISDSLKCFKQPLSQKIA